MAAASAHAVGLKGARHDPMSLVYHRRAHNQYAQGQVLGGED
jgi:hypothetical protein